MMVDEQVRIAVITAGVVMEGLLREVVMDAVREWRREGRGCATGRCICEGGNSHPDDAAEKVNPAHGGAVWSEAVVRPTNGWLCARAFATMPFPGDSPGKTGAARGGLKNHCRNIGKHWLASMARCWN